MKRKPIILVVLMIFVLTIGAAVLTACNDNDKPKTDDNLIFCDDFNALDTSIWNVYTKKTDTDPGWGPESGVRRGAYWDKDQVFTENGNLIIRTEFKDGVCYTGAIDSDNKLEMHYGYYEARCKVPLAYGMWSAFWIFCDEMGAANPDPDVCGCEIDIFESPYYGVKVNGKRVFQSALHMGDYGSNYNKVEKLVNAVNIYDGEFHTFGLDWQEGYYRFYVDGIMTIEITPEKDDIKISQKDSFLFLSCEVGGSNGVVGETPFAFARLLADESMLSEESTPVDFVVDYVKIYKTMPQA